MPVARPDRSECDIVRETLWPLDRPRPYSEHEEEARKHLGQCGACQAFFARDAALVRAIARHGATARAPESLRQRIREALARENAQDTGGLATPIRSRGRIARFVKGIGREGWAVAALVLALLVGVGLAQFTRAARVDAVYAQDYLNRAVQDHAIRTDDPMAVSRFFLHEMGVGILPVALDEGQMSRAMVCLLKDREAAMVEYTIGQHVVAHYRVPASADDGTESSGIKTTSERGVHVVSWTEGGFEQALVSDLPIEQLVALARTSFSSR